MCLITTDIKRKVANEDIIVFKIFGKDNKSLYQKFDYTPFIGKRYDETEEEEVNMITNHIIKVSGGFVHSFSDWCRVKGILMMKEDEEVELIIRKCIIPKGSEYYYSDFWNEYASKSIIIGDIVYG